MSDVSQQNALVAKEAIFCDFAQNDLSRISNEISDTGDRLAFDNWGSGHFKAPRFAISGGENDIKILMSSNAFNCFGRNALFT